MAPKLGDIKSESWLDLTKEQPIKRPKWLLRRAQTQVPDSDSNSASSASWSDKDGPCFNDQDQLDCDEEKFNYLDQRGQNKARAKTNVISQKLDGRKLSTCSTASTAGHLQTNSQNHLLIRIRQESFRLSRRRSSLSDMSSNERSRKHCQEDMLHEEQATKETRTRTSQSIMSISCTASLEHSLKISDLIDELHDGGDNNVCNGKQSKTMINNNMKRGQQQVSLSSRLQRFKSRLESRTRRSSSLLRTDIDMESTPNIDLEESSVQYHLSKDRSFMFNQRSFSSLGEKFTHFRRSWRKFLSSSTQSINQHQRHSDKKHVQQKLNTKNIIEPDHNIHRAQSLISHHNQVRKLDWRAPDDVTDPINKLILTERWLANHHQFERPRSLQVDRSQLAYSQDNKLGLNNHRHQSIVDAYVDSKSIGRDSSSSTTLVEPQLSSQQHQEKEASYQQDYDEPLRELVDQLRKPSIDDQVPGRMLKGRAISLEPSRLANNITTTAHQFQKNTRRPRTAFNKNIFSDSNNCDNKFASLKTDTEGSSTTSSKTTTSSSHCSYALGAGHRMNIMQQGDYNKFKQYNCLENQLDTIADNQQQLATHIDNNLSSNMINQHLDQRDRHQQPQLDIPSFAPIDEYYLEPANAKGENQIGAAEILGRFAVDNNHQHHLINQMELHHRNRAQDMLSPSNVGLWPMMANSTGMSQPRGHSVEAQLSTGGSSSLERSQGAPYNHSIMMQNPNNAVMVHQQQLMMFNNNHNDHEMNMIGPIQTDPDYDDYAIPSDDNFCRLDRNQVELVQMIGEGQKGFVFLGKLQSRDGQQMIDVAIKTLKYETEAMIEKLMHEAAMMRQFEHPHIIRFIGVCPETPALIAMELAKLGELRHYLRANQHLISVSQLVLFSFQISTALSYLESKQFVHRDVAARNVLVCSHTCVKLADFGLSRNLQVEPAGCQFVACPPTSRIEPPTGRNNHSASNTQLNHASSQLLLQPEDKSGHYVAISPGKLPVRWLAPESLAFRRFTSASDVWMFAVCAWEIFYLGQLRPWPHIANNQVLTAIGAGQRLTRPPACPARLYQLMLQCWSFAPIQRPKFRDIKQELWSIYLSERAREQILIDEVEREKQESQMMAMAAAVRQQQHEQQQHEKRMRQILKQQELNKQLQRSQSNFIRSSNKLVQHEPEMSKPKVEMNVWPLAGVSSSSDKKIRPFQHETCLSYANISPEPKTSKTPSPQDSNNSANSSLARRRRLLLRSSGSGHTSASVPAPISISKTSCSRSNQDDDFVNSDGSFRSRNQLQKQRSHGSIYGVDKSVSPLASYSGHSHHKDDQALLDEKRRERRNQILQPGHSERLLHFPPQKARLSNDHHDLANRQLFQVESEVGKKMFNKKVIEPPLAIAAMRPHQDNINTIHRLSWHQPAYEGVTGASSVHDRAIGNITTAVQDMQLSNDKSTNHDDESLDQFGETNHPSLSEAQRHELEQRNRLDLHRRLLGHIRPASSASSARARDRANRNSLNLMTVSEVSSQTVQEQQLHQHHHHQERPLPHPPNMSSSNRVESVDQSLEILASLISTTKTTSSKSDGSRSQNSRKNELILNDLAQSTKARTESSSSGKAVIASTKADLAETPRPKSRALELQQQWRKIGREFEKVRRRANN